MNQLLRHDDRLRALFGVMVALVLMARLLAPSGFMPVLTSHGVMVTLCTGQGAMRMMVERESVPDGRHHDEDKGAQEHCPFAGAASAPSMPAQPILPVLAVWHLPTGPIAFALRTGWISRIAAPPPPSSGPPPLLA